jgi:hypothetical protein
VHTDRGKRENVVKLLGDWEDTNKHTQTQSVIMGEIGWFGVVFALAKHIRGGWSHYTDTSEPVDGGVQL